MPGFVTLSVMSGHCLTQSGYGDYFKEVYILSYGTRKGQLLNFQEILKKKKRKTQLLRRDQHFSFLKGMTIFPDKIECEEDFQSRKQNAVMSEMLEIVLYVSVVVKQDCAGKEESSQAIFQNLNLCSRGGRRY